MNTTGQTHTPDYGGPVFDILASRLADFAMTISGSENITFDLST